VAAVAEVLIVATTAISVFPFAGVLPKVTVIGLEPAVAFADCTRVGVL
jgi:hypothetical protein